MLIARLPVDEQLDALRTTLSRNEMLMEVLARAAKLDLPGWYLTAGCVFQTVWNVVTDRPPNHGIKDYDLFYFDDSDLGWDAEDQVIRTGEDTFRDLAAAVEIRNEARVHLWYEDHFGVPCTPYTSSEAAIDSFAATTCCLGIRLDGDDRWRVYAPHGLATCSTSSSAPTPSSLPAASTRPKPDAGANTGLISPCCHGPEPASSASSGAKRCTTTWFRPRTVAASRMERRSAVNSSWLSELDGDGRPPAAALRSRFTVDVEEDAWLISSSSG